MKQPDPKGPGCFYSENLISYEQKKSGRSGRIFLLRIVFMLQEIERLDLRTGSVFNGHQSRPMPPDHDQCIKDAEDPGLHAEADKGEDRKYGRNHDGAKRKVAGEKNDDQSGNIGNQPEQRIGDEDGGTGDRDAFSSVPFVPEREVVTEDASETGIEDSQVPGHFHQIEAEQAGKKCLAEIAGQDRDAPFDSETVCDIGHPRIPCSEFAAGFVCHGMRHDFSSQDASEDITDQNTAEAFQHRFSLSEFD
jgi:hypothetical protein